MKRRDAISMNRERMIEAIDYIKKQIENGYVDLNQWDVAEVEIIERAIREYEINHRLGTF